MGRRCEAFGGVGAIRGLERRRRAETEVRVLAGCI